MPLLENQWFRCLLVAQHVQIVAQGWGIGSGTSMGTGVWIPRTHPHNWQEWLLPVILVFGRPRRDPRANWLANIGELQVQ